MHNPAELFTADEMFAFLSDVFDANPLAAQLEQEDVPLYYLALRKFVEHHYPKVREYLRSRGCDAAPIPPAPKYTRKKVSTRRAYELYDALRTFAESRTAAELVVFSIDDRLDPDAKLASNQG